MEENTMAIVLKVLGVIEAICGVFAGSRCDEGV